MGTLAWHGLSGLRLEQLARLASGSRVRVVDFGLAGLVQAEQGTAAGTDIETESPTEPLVSQAARGAPAYMAPEQWIEAKDLDWAFERIAAVLG